MRKSKQTSRRKRAFRWLALLACMIAWMVVPGRFRFLPGQAIREAERLGKMGSTQLIAELPGYEGRTLRGNSKGLMISLLTESIVERGWDLEYRVYLDCSVPQPFYVGISSYHFPGEEGSNWLDSLTDWFGRIDDPAAAAVRRSAEEPLSRQQIHRLGDLGLHQPPVLRHVPGGVIVRVVGQKQQHMDLPHSEAVPLQKRGELPLIKAGKLFGKQQQPGGNGGHGNPPIVF